MSGLYGLIGANLASSKLIGISFVSFLVFLFILYFLKNRKNFYFYTVILSSLLPLVSLLRTGVHQSGDFAINIVKAVDLWVSVSHGIFPVHWASLLNANYGYPLFLFTYPLPYYSVVLLKFVGFSFIASEKITIAAVFILSGVGMYLLARHFLKPAQSALSSILYLFAPYHLVDMHFRVALGELFAYAFLPFVFYFLISLKKKTTPLFLLLLFLSFFCLILSHQAISLIATPFIMLIPLFLKLEAKTTFFIYVALLASLFISSFYWLPLISSIQYTHQIDYAKTIGFENPLLYLFSPWRFTMLYQGPSGQLSFPMGFAQLTLLLLSLFLLLKKRVKKDKRKLLLILLALFGLLTTMLLPISEPVWKILPFMTNFQFAYRLMLPISFLLALIGGIAASYIYDKRVLVLIMLFSILLTILNWGTRAVIPDITDRYLIQRTPYATHEGEGLQPASPKWRNPQKIWMEHLPAAPAEVVAGNASIEKGKRTPVEHNYRIVVSEQSKLRENTFYFPGWNLYVNGKRYPFSYQDGEKTNLIHFSLPPGRYEVSLKFEPTKVISFANTLSIISGVFYMLMIIYFSFHRRK